MSPTEFLRRHSSRELAMIQALNIVENREAEARRQGGNGVKGKSKAERAAGL